MRIAEPNEKPVKLLTPEELKALLDPDGVTFDEHMELLERPVSK